MQLNCLSLLHSEWPKLFEGFLAILSAIRLAYQTFRLISGRTYAVDKSIIFLFSSSFPEWRNCTTSPPIMVLTASTHAEVLHLEFNETRHCFLWWANRSSDRLCSPHFWLSRKKKVNIKVSDVYLFLLSLYTLMVKGQMAQ